MRKMYKTQKGITLVALVITIIVLIILAAVSINAIKNDGLIKNAETAVGKYEVAKKEEETELGKLLQKIENAKGESPEPAAITWTGAWVGDDYVISNNINSTTFKRGDIVTYTQSGEATFEVISEKSGVEGDSRIINRPEQITWYVLGVYNGQLQLIGNKTTSVDFYGQEGWNNAISVANDMFTSFYGDNDLGTYASGFGSETSLEHINPYSDAFALWGWNQTSSPLPLSFSSMNEYYLDGGPGTSNYSVYQNWIYSDNVMDMGVEGWITTAPSILVEYGTEKQVVLNLLPVVSLGPTVMPVAAN